MLPAPARGALDDLIARLDRALPGRVEGLYVVGSTSLGAFREGRSDVDFVAIVDGDLGPAELARLRAVHLGHWASALARCVALRGRWPLACNGCYLRSGDLARSPLDVTPLAGQVAGRFGTGKRGAFDVNPVTWHTLAHHGIAIRGPVPERVAIRADDAELRTWTVGNLNGYWRRWAEDARTGRVAMARALPRRFAAGGVLGVPRLHHTLASGAVATKEDAAAHALETFDARWHPLIEDALAFWHGLPARPPYRRRPGRRRRDAADFVAAVIDAANGLRPIASGAHG
jgi:hypothetical protein